MTTWQLVLTGVILASILVGTLWYIWRPKINILPQHHPKDNKVVATEEIEKDTETVFNDEFREELRNRGRLHFENIITENAMFLQQDLRLTTSQLNEYMKGEIIKVLQDEFGKYEESIESAKDVALEAIKKTQAAIDQQRETLEQQLGEEVNKEKGRLIENFEKNMADIVNHYLLAAIGNEIDLDSQLDYIFQHLEENKEAITADIKNGT